MTQREQMKEHFEKNEFTWIPCYELVKFSLQYNARIYELRADGMIIDNKTKSVDGKKHSWYMYKPSGRLF